MFVITCERPPLDVTVIFSLSLNQAISVTGLKLDVIMVARVKLS